MMNREDALRLTVNNAERRVKEAKVALKLAEIELTRAEIAFIDYVLDHDNEPEKAA